MRWLRQLPPIPLPLPVLVGAAALVGGATLLTTCHHRQRDEGLVHIQLMVEGPAPGETLRPGEAQILGRMLATLMEAHPGITVHHLAPGQAPWGLPGPWTRLVLRPRRVGTNLQIGLLRQSWRGSLPAGQVLDIVGTPDRPLDALGHVLEGMGLEMPDTPQDHLAFFPDSPQAFWNLVSLQAAPLEGGTALESLEGLRALLATHPRTPGLWLAFGRVLETQLWAHPDRGATDLHQEVRQAFEHAQDLAPGHPEVIAALAQHLALRGEHAQALELLKPQLRLRPDHPRLLAAAATATRDAGLLTLARRFHASGPQHHHVPDSSQSLDRLHLYTGEWELYEREIEDVMRLGSCSLTAFNLGYLRMLQKRPKEAETAFEQAARGQGPHAELAELFLDILRGEPASARVRLTYVGRARIGHLVPDGTLAFHMAEAAAALGELEMADELAARAYAQGFCCLTWYEHSPFLASLQGSAAFRDLLVRISERQQSLARTYHDQWLG